MSGMGPFQGADDIVAFEPRKTHVPDAHGALLQCLTSCLLHRAMAIWFTLTDPVIWKNDIVSAALSGPLLYHMLASHLHHTSHFTLHHSISAQRSLPSGITPYYPVENINLAQTTNLGFVFFHSLFLIHVASCPEYSPTPPVMFDTSSGQVYKEWTLPRHSLSAQPDLDWSRRRPYPLFTSRGSRGPRSLLDMTINTIANNIGDVTEDHLDAIPARLLWRIWRFLEARFVSCQPPLP